MMLAEQCEVHLAQATATNSPSRRYSIILEELRNESRKEFQGDVLGTPPIGTQSIPIGATDLPAVNHATSMPFTSPSMPQTNVPTAVPTAVPVGPRNPFMNWQTSDWLEIDASVSPSRCYNTSKPVSLTSMQAYGIIPGFSLRPNLQWYGGA